LSCRTRGCEGEKAIRIKIRMRMRMKMKMKMKMKRLFTPEDV
jgi:hypothetical protein